MRKGFTLVELSIVFVILGLLAGGIIVGQALIRASELRSIATDANRYTIAINTFRDQYLALPGDIKNATQFWNADAAPASCATQTSQTPREETCDGNGDGYVGNGDVLDVAGMNEAFRAMQQLANARLIPGQYAGVSGPGRGAASHAIPGVNIPRSKISLVGWSYAYHISDDIAAPGVHRGFVADENYNVLTIGTEGDLAGMSDGPFLKTDEAWNIDTKVDDGKPISGDVRGYFAGVDYLGLYPTPCTDGTTPTSGYDVANKAPNSCGLDFIIH